MSGTFHLEEEQQQQTYILKDEQKLFSDQLAKILPQTTEQRRNFYMGEIQKLQQEIQDIQNKDQSNKYQRDADQEQAENELKIQQGEMQKLKTKAEDMDNKHSEKKKQLQDDIDNAKEKQSTLQADIKKIQEDIAKEDEKINQLRNKQKELMAHKTPLQEFSFAVKDRFTRKNIQDESFAKKQLLYSIKCIAVCLKEQDAMHCIADFSEILRKMIDEEVFRQAIVEFMIGHKIQVDSKDQDKFAKSITDEFLRCQWDQATLKFMKKYIKTKCAQKRSQYNYKISRTQQLKDKLYDSDANDDECVEFAVFLVICMGKQVRVEEIKGDDAESEIQVRFE